MSVTRRLAAVGLLAMGFVLWQPGFASAQAEPESETEAGGAFQNYVTWNLCQSACHSPENSQARYDTSVRFSSLVTGSTTKPRAVAAQEMCQSGYTYARQQLDGIDHEYDSIFYQAKATSACPNGVGVALFWRSSCGSGCRIAEAFDVQHPGDLYPDEGPPERRGYACGRSNSRSAWYCSAHITFRNSTVGCARCAQLSQYRDQSATWRENGRATVMMGDFNAIPNAPGLGMALWYDLHVEADACTSDPSCRHTYKVVSGDPDAQNDKLDYIFAHDFFCDRHGTPPNVRRYGTLSDHAWVRGYIVCPN